jgi:hypothetical protein
LNLYLLVVIENLFRLLNSVINEIAVVEKKKGTKYSHLVPFIRIDV